MVLRVTLFTCLFEGLLVVFVLVGFEVVGGGGTTESHNCHLHRGFYIGSIVAAVYIGTAIYIAVKHMSCLCSNTRYTLLDTLPRKGGLFELLYFTFLINQ